MQKKILPLERQDFYLQWQDEYYSLITKFLVVARLPLETRAI